MKAVTPSPMRTERLLSGRAGAASVEARWERRLRRVEPFTGAYAVTGPTPVDMPAW